MERLDVYLVKHNIVSTRSKAKQLIENGEVFVNESLVKKSGYSVCETDNIVLNNAMKYVSRAGYKLEKAISEFGLDFTNKVAIDIGASTGGFTDCMLQNNIKYIFAIDVGTNQFSKELLSSNKITLYEKKDIREYKNQSNNQIDIAVCDVSFISVTTFSYKLKELNINELVILIKPQFECGKNVAKKYNGVIKSKQAHKDAIRNVVNSFVKEGYSLFGLCESSIKGGSGNTEYLSYFKLNEKCDLNNELLIENVVNKVVL